MNSKARKLAAANRVINRERAVGGGVYYTNAATLLRHVADDDWAAEIPFKEQLEMSHTVTMFLYDAPEWAWLEETRREGNTLGYLQTYIREHKVQSHEALMQVLDKLLTVRALQRGGNE